MARIGVVTMPPRWMNVGQNGLVTSKGVKKSFAQVVESGSSRKSVFSRISTAGNLVCQKSAFSKISYPHVYNRKNYAKDFENSKRARDHSVLRSTASVF